MSHEGRRAVALHHTQRASRRWYLLGGLAVAALLGAAAILTLRPAPAPPLVDAQDPTLGAAGAPVTLVEFADYQCPYCRNFETNVLPQVEQQQIASGQVRLVFKDFPIVGDDSWTAARASQYVWAHANASTYWAWHAGMYARQGGENSGWASLTNLVSYSQQFGLDPADMRASLQRADYQQEVRADKDAGVARGVSSTPTLLVDGKIVNGVDYASLARAIAQASAAAGG